MENGALPIIVMCLSIGTPKNNKIFHLFQIENLLFFSVAKFGHMQPNYNVL